MRLALSESLSHQWRLATLRYRIHCVPELKITRRHFLQGVTVAPLVAISATSAYASLIEPYNYRVSETDIFIRDLPGRFEGFRITQLTDVHHSRIVPIDQVHRVVQLARATKPDLIALTGDYTTSYRRYIEPCAEALGSLNAPEGVWAVLGNHDHYTDPELTTRASSEITSLCSTTATQLFGAVQMRFSSRELMTGRGQAPTGYVLSLGLMKNAARFCFPTSPSFSILSNHRKLH